MEADWEKGIRKTAGKSVKNRVIEARRHESFKKKR